MMQRVLRILSHLDLKHDERRRARISRGYKAGELQPHYLIQLKCQGYSLQLTGTSGLVGEGGVEGVFEAFRG